MKKALLLSFVLLIVIFYVLQLFLFRRTSEMGKNGCIVKTSPSSDKERADLNKDGCTTKDEYDAYIKSLEQ